MLVRMWILCLGAVLVLGSPQRYQPEDKQVPIHVIDPPNRCPAGQKPDSKGRCRDVWERRNDDVEDAEDEPQVLTNVIDPTGRCPPGQMPDRYGRCRDISGWWRNDDVACPEGQEPDGNDLCRQTIPVLDCLGEHCEKVKSLQKRDISPSEDDQRMEAQQSEKKSKKRSNLEKGKAGKRERSKHAFLMMLKKKKMQMMKPKPPAPPPHHPPHHHPPHHEESAEQPEEEPPEEDTPAPERVFFADEPCIEGENSTGGCPSDAEMVEKVEANDDFKEWKPEVSSESSESSSESSSSSDSTGESGSVGGSGESEDEVFQKAIQMKLNKLFRMKQRYGPALRRWLVTQLREYEDRKEKKEIISTRCLEAVKETMEVIKDNLEVDGLFTTSGNLRTRKKIQSYLSRGDIYTLRNWGFEFVVECAAALKIFLQNLPQPLIPVRIQQLVVAENSGVPEKTIANDALGLLKEEVNGRHKELLLEVFTFLKEAAVKVNTSELTGCNLPLKLLPVFFDVESNDPQKFRDIATVFHEIIMEAPEHLKTPCRKIPSGELKIIERILSQDMRVATGPLVDPRTRRNQPTGENAEWRIPVPRVPHTRLHPWLGRVEHSTSA